MARSHGSSLEGALFRANFVCFFSCPAPRAGFSGVAVGLFCAKFLGMTLGGILGRFAGDLGMSWRFWGDLGGSWVDLRGILGASGGMLGGVVLRRVSVGGLQFLSFHALSSLLSIIELSQAVGEYGSAIRAIVAEKGF